MKVATVVIESFSKKACLKGQKNYAGMENVCTFAADLSE